MEEIPGVDQHVARVKGGKKGKDENEFQKEVSNKVKVVKGSFSFTFRREVTAVVEESKNISKRRQGDRSKTEAAAKALSEEDFSKEVQRNRMAQIKKWEFVERIIYREGSLRNG